jgi:two-component system, NtrC family, sensor kinase
MDAPGKKDWLLDERLLQSQKLAAIGELSAGIAHEINNPLAIIRQEAEWMGLLLRKLEGRDLEEIAELNGSVRQIVQQVDRCTEITRNLLDFARKRDPVIQAVEVNRIIEDMTMLVEKEARHKNITIIRDYDQELPLIYSDAPQLRQVILNFLTNATQAIGKDGRITITTRRRGSDAVDLIFSDTGCGIPEENLRKIFDPFFTTKAPGKGTGLGLSICHGIILCLGGQISVESQVGQGATFTITLPLSRETELFPMTNE